VNSADRSQPAFLNINGLGSSSPSQICSIAYSPAARTELLRLALRPQGGLVDAASWPELTEMLFITHKEIYEVSEKHYGSPSGQIAQNS